MKKKPLVSENDELEDRDDSKLLVFKNLKS